ncbi:hypothetical protein GGF32_009678 [Allomyces javanicus]|nr:hypothetical protein GGF32_009678 [Allomyces javanicus]
MSAIRRVRQVTRLLARAPGHGDVLVPHRGFATTSAEQGRITIGDVSVPIRDAPVASAVPVLPMGISLEDQVILKHLQWMMKKDLLGQDIFLLGPPGPMKRQLALAYCHLTNRSVEYIALHRDVSGEADIKQRREVQRTPVERVAWVDGPAVRAATLGSVLILDGVQHAERNTLPVLNNLLENREMTLEDGRHLVHPARYDALLQQHSRDELERWNLVRTSENFRVIALGLPVPPFRGNPLDPPFRSRFMVRYVDGNVGYWQLGGKLGELRDSKVADLVQTVQYSHATKNSLDVPRFAQTALSALQQLKETFPRDHDADHLALVYPTFGFSSTETAGLGRLSDKFNLLPDSSHPAPPLNFSGNVVDQTMTVQVGTNHEVTVKAGTAPTRHASRGPARMVMTDRVQKAMYNLLKAHTLGDLVVVGPKSSGKSLLLSEFGQQLGYHVNPFYLYRDMNARDLLQRRATDQFGNTIWEDSPLVQAALRGELCLLEGLQHIEAGAVESLARLVLDREICLPDGSRLMSRRAATDLATTLGCSVDDLPAQHRIRVIHDAFRLAAVATLPKDPVRAELKWFSEELTSMFRFVEVPAMDNAEMRTILTAVTGCSAEVANQLVAVASAMKDHDSFKETLTLRQLLRLARHQGRGMHRDLHRVFMTSFVPPFIRKSFDEVLERLGVFPSTDAATDTTPATLAPPLAPQDVSLIPHVPDFHVNPLHARLLRDLAAEWATGDHLLLIGNQGVGKNKLTDQFLQQHGRARQYMQLHRDSTVGSLMVSPAIENGVLVYQDSPLVKAIKDGYVAVVDEADKAPVHVVSVLKSLAETGEMTLTNGVRVVNSPENASPNDIVLHPDFRMILLANRPGYPFLGNDFFSVIGDVFSCHPINNLDPESELEVLKKSAPNLPDELLRRLIAAFQELRQSFDDGMLSYPLSLRELLALLKHMKAYPGDPIAASLRDIFDFDLHGIEMQQVILPVLSKHGFPVNDYSLESVTHGGPGTSSARLEINKEWGPTDTSAPKHGKEDPENKPHVGGNTWAGGTGGRDTAGLGGIGGPYRLDKGHDVHQVSDEVKAAVPEHIKQAARAMGQDALKARLAEIKMHASEMKAYTQLRDPVVGHIQQLRRILQSLRSEKDEERTWLRHQTDGELDEAKLVDGLTGEHAVYMRRGVETPDPHAPKPPGSKPKRLRIVFDVSASMYRFNGVDGRLTRSLECALMLMESLDGIEPNRLVYDFVGHSGDSSKIALVAADKPPRTDMDRFKVLETMVAHSQYCWAGDTTLEATKRAIDELAKDKDKYDSLHVVVLSDANLRRYGIQASTIARALETDKNVHAAMIMIGTLGDEATQIKKALPAGKGFIVPAAQQLPSILRQVFASHI